MRNLPEMKKGTVVLLSVVAVILAIGTVIMLGSGAVRVRDVFAALKDLNPRLMGFMALPFIVVAILVGKAWFSKREERMWKAAMKKTREARQQEAEKK